MATTESRRIGANTPAPSSCVIIRRLKYPSPLCAPSHSPIAAPMMDSGTAILMAEKKQGSTAGIFNLKKIWRLSAPNVNSSSSISVFTDLNPSNTVIVIGKNVINTVTSTLLQMEYPNQSTNNGASAVVGIVCDAMISGYNAFSATSLTSIRIASPSPSTTEIKSPIATTDMVAGRCAVKSGPLNSHNRTRICMGDGRIYAALIPIAAICQNIISAARRISAGRLAFPAFFLSLIRSPS